MNRPNIVDYNSNYELYFKDLDFWYKNFNRPIKYKVHQQKKVLYRSIFGKIFVDITRYYFYDEYGIKRTSYIQQQIDEINNFELLLTLIKKQSLNSSCSLNEIAKIFNNSYKKSSIWNIISNNIENIKEPEQEKNNDFKPSANDSNIIYVEVDDCYKKIRQSLHKIISYRHRTIVIHKGVINGKCIDKYVLLESLPVKNIGLSVNKLAKLIRLKINEIYGIKKPKIVFISDGARWMKRLSKLLNSIHVLDFFHVSKRLREAIGYGKYNTKNKSIFASIDSSLNTTFYQYIKNLILENNVNKAIFELQKLCENSSSYLLSNSKILQIKSLIRYLELNKKLMCWFNENWYIGSRTEIFISHLIKKKTNRKFAIFGLKRFRFLIKSQENENLKFHFI